MIANESTFRVLLRKGWDPVIIADRLLLGLARARLKLALPLARAASRLIDSQEWFTFGYARLEDHARERFGRSSRWVGDLRDLDESVTLYPSLGKALAGSDGSPPLGTVACLIVARVLTAQAYRNGRSAPLTASNPEACAAWIALARRVSVRDLRERARAAMAEARESIDDGTDESLPARAGPSRPLEAQVQSDSQGRPPGAARSASGDTESPSTSEDVWDAERVTLRFLVPPSVGVAFDEARDLHAAVVGGEATISEFIEAMLAETFSGPVTPMVNEGWIGARPSSATRERNPERKAEGWSFLRDVTLDGEDLCAAWETLEEADRLTADIKGRSCTADSSIRALLRLENEIEMRIGDLLSLMGESGAWRGLRFAGVGHYAEERLGMSRSVAQSRCRMSRLLRERRLLREACEKGRLGLDAAALVARAMEVNATTDARGSLPAEAAWIERAEESTVKRLREEVRIVERESAFRSGESPAMPVDDETWQRSRSRRAGQTISRIERLVESLREDPHASLLIHFRLPFDLASMLRSALDAERRRLDGICRGKSIREDTVPVGSGLTELVEGGSSSSDYSCARRAALMFSTRFGVVPEWCAFLALIEGFVRTWDDPRGCPRRAADAIYIRDGYRCSAPGCTSRRNLEEHHIEYRSRGGDESAHNKVTLCRFHHQQGEHQGLMRCRGRAPLGILWSMGRMGVGGLFRNERSLDVARRRRPASAARTSAPDLRDFDLTHEGLPIHRAWLSPGPIMPPRSQAALRG